MTVGGRYSKDKKQAFQAGYTNDAFPVVRADYDTFNRATYDSFDPRIVATYKFSPDVNVYASYSTGFKSGGFQYVPFNEGAANTLFRPEDIKTYEIGLKSEWLDRKLRVNIAAFKYDYKNLQVSRIFIPAGSSGAPESLIDNAAASKVKGVDLEILMRPSRNFEVGVTYGYLDAKYKDYISAGIDFDGTRMVRAPKHTVNVGGEWRLPFSDDSRLVVRADYALVGSFLHEPGETNPLTREEGYGLLDLRASYEFSNFRLTAYMNNAGNIKYRRTINQLNVNTVGFAGTPRIYGLKAAFTY